MTGTGRDDAGGAAGLGIYEVHRRVVRRVLFLLNSYFLGRDGRCRRRRFNGAGNPSVVVLVTAAVAAALVALHDALRLGTAGRHGQPGQLASGEA